MEVKTCSRCGEEKSFEEFYRKIGYKHNLSPHCKICSNAGSKLSREKKHEKYKDLREKWKLENKDKYNFYRNEWGKRNKPYKTFHAGKRRSMKKQAAVSWRNDFFIEEAYKLAELREKVTGIKWNVDHIVPLQSKLVCGLHWEGNLQVIPASENFKKGNRCWPEMP